MCNYKLLTHFSAFLDQEGNEDGKDSGWKHAEMGRSISDALFRTWLDEGWPIVLLFACFMLFLFHMLVVYIFNRSRYGGTLFDDYSSGRRDGSVAMDLLCWSRFSWGNVRMWRSRSNSHSDSRCWFLDLMDLLAYDSLVNQDALSEASSLRAVWFTIKGCLA